MPTYDNGPGRPRRISPPTQGVLRINTSTDTTTTQQMLRESLTPTPPLLAVLTLIAIFVLIAVAACTPAIIIIAWKGAL